MKSESRIRIEKRFGSITLKLRPTATNKTYLIHCLLYIYVVCGKIFPAYTKKGHFLYTGSNSIIFHIGRHLSQHVSLTEVKNCLHETVTRYAG